MADALLKIGRLTKRFGGVVASDDVVLRVERGELHAIIDPNGAGKTTLIGQLTGELTILLIEHNMEAVFALADRISLLVYGRIIATSAPTAIRANAEVRAAYLGEQEATHG